MGTDSKEQGKKPTTYTPTTQMFILILALETHILVYTYICIRKHIHTYIDIHWSAGITYIT